MLVGCPCPGRSITITYHALLDSSVGNHIDNVADLVLLEVGRQSDHTLLLEVAREGCSPVSAELSSL